MKRYLALVLFALVGCQPEEAKTTTTAKPPLPTVTITTAPVTLREVPRQLMLVGSLTGADEVILSPKVDGRIARVYADVGDLIYPNETILELDPVDLKLEVDAARRALEAELARLGLKELPVGELKFEEVPSVVRAEVTVETTKRELDRIKNLQANGSITQREFDAANFEFKAAEATKQDTITQARALLSSARLRQANLDAAEQRLRDAKLSAPPVPIAQAWGAVAGSFYAPIRYAVAARMVTEGEMIRSNPVTNAFRLVLDFIVKLRTPVPEQYAPDVRIGQLVRVRVDAYPDTDFPGRITRINPTVDRSSRTFNVEISIPNLQSRLKAGGFAKAFLTTRIDDAVRTVPPQAVVSFAGVSKVFIIENNIAKAVEVTIGQRDPNWVEILGKLPPNATIATSGFSQLVEGSPTVTRP